MIKEQGNSLGALKSGELAKSFIVIGEGIQRVTQGVEKSYDAARGLEIRNLAENNANLQMQKAAQAQRA